MIEPIYDAQDAEDQLLYEAIMDNPRLYCSKCLSPLDLRSIPEAALQSEWHRRLAARRKTHAGAKRKPAECPKCGVMCESTRLAVSHCYGTGKLRV